MTKRERLNCTTEAICLAREKFKTLIALDRKLHMNAVLKYFRRNFPDIELGYETQSYMECSSPFALSLEQFSGRKALTDYISKMDTHM